MVRGYSKKMELTYQIQTPTPQQWRMLRESVGWGDNGFSEESIRAGLANTVYGVCAYDGERTVGMARVVGDGHMYFFLQDVIVHAQYQHHGIGRRMVELLLEHIEATAEPHSHIGLMAAKGKESFYEQFGFSRRPNEHYGAGMVRTTK